MSMTDIIQERKLVIQLVIMASLPWLTENYTPDPEANFCVTEEVKSLALTLKPLLSDEILRVCLLSVIVASKEILPKWRLHILRTVSVSSGLEFLEKVVCVQILVNRWLTNMLVRYKIVE